MLTSGSLNTLGSVILWGSGIYHLVVGVLSMLSTKLMRKLAGVLYALKIPENLDPRYEYIWKPLGAFAVWVAVFCFRGVWGAQSNDTQYQRFLVWALAGLYVARALQRWVYRDLFFRAFGVPFKRSLFNIAFNLALAFLMVNFSFS